MEGNRIEVEVDGSPTPSIQWLKNGQEVKDDLSDGKKHALVVSPTESSSNYSVIVKSGDQSSSSDQISGNVTIRSDPALKDVTVHLNTEVILTVNTSEYNRSDITWSKESVTSGTAESRSASYKLQVTQTSEQIAAPAPTTPSEPVVKPKIKRGLSDVSAIQNQKDTELVVETETSISESSSSKESRAVKWFVDDIEIVEIDTRYKIVTEESSGTYKLIVKEANEGTAGLYKCKISNEAGYSETSAEFTVSSKPEFMQELEDREALEGETISMDVVIAGNPKPDIKWLRNGVDVSSDESILIEKESDTVYILTIEKVTSNSIGTYECVISNRVGETRSKGILSLLTEPSFTTDLGGITSGKVGENIALEVVVEGNPRPSVNWFKDGVQISTTVVSEHTDNKFRLRFEPVELEDGAEYYCVAKNRIGEKTSRKIRFTVETEEKVYPKEEPPKVKPSILRGLSDTSVSPGDTLVLKVTVDGNPEPSVTWCKDSTPLGTIGPDSGDASGLPDNVSMAKDGNTHTLVVKNVSKADEASYTCNVKNDAGETSSASQVTVTEGVQKPVITGLSDAVGTIGGDLKLEVIVDGAPAPTVTWLKDGQEMDKGSQVSDGVTHKLLLKKLKSSDEGTYTCRATNSSGETDAIANVSITPTVPTVTGLEDTKADVGSTAFLKATVTGHPPPTVTWTKDGKELVADSNILITEEGDLRRVTVRKMSKNEAGKYEIKVKNSAGEVSSTAIVSIGESSPSFVSNIPSSLSLNEGDVMRLEGKVDGNPLPNIKWMKDGQELLLDDRMKLDIKDDGTVVLTIKDVKASDQGKYELVATNGSGTVTSASDVKVAAKEAEVVVPKFKRQLCNVDASTNECFKLEVTVDTSSLTNESVITWLKDGIEINTSSDTRVKLVNNDSNDGTYSITISNADLKDAGEYTCCFKNPGTEGVVTKARVSIKEGTIKPSIESLNDAEPALGSSIELTAIVNGVPEPIVTWLKDGHEITASNKLEIGTSSDGKTHKLTIGDVRSLHQGNYTCRATNSAGSTDVSASLKVKPVAPVISGLDDVKAEGGQTVVLDIFVTGHPASSITWFRDGEEIVASSNILITEEESLKGTSHKLTIRSMGEKDIGSYKVVAKNSAGESSSSAQVQIGEAAPTILQELPSNIKLIEGNVLILQAKVSGSPLPKVKWMKDRSELVLDDRMDQVMRPDGTVILTIRDVKVSDQGEYELIVVNSQGQATNHSSVTVAARDVLPKFVKELTRAEVEIGQSAKMEAKVIGNPAPEIKWYKDDIALKTSERIKTNQTEDGLLTIEIENVTEEDLGLYKILASNRAGEKISIAPLRTPRHELPTKPEFVVHLLDADFEEDSQLILTCKVRGSPDPKIKWLRDGEELVCDGDRIKSTMDEDGHITLTIENIQMDEAGKYVCTAMNSEGRTRTAAQVNTFKKRAGERAKTPKKPIEEPDRRSKFQPSDFEIPDRVKPERDPIHVSSESHYQNGPDTMLLQYRDPDYPLRVREYLRVGARESPYLANNLRSSYWGDADIGYGFSPQVAVRERRRFSAIVKEIQTEVTTGEPATRGRRFFSPHHPEMSSSSSSDYRSSSTSRTAVGTSSSSFLSSSSNYRSTTSSSPFKYSRS